MTRKDIRDAYNSVTPTSEEKAKMLDAILSAVPSDVPVRKENNMKKYTKKPMVLVAMLAVSVILMGAAAVFTLKDLKIGDYTPPTQPGQTQAAEARDMISLQGFARSDSFKASKEWRDFEDAYDPDYKKMDEADAAGYVAPEDYLIYPCYTQEMVDKVDAICKKYKLEPLGRTWMETKADKMFEMLGIPGITAKTPKAAFKLYSGYYFEGGTFALEGDAALNGSTFDFQYRCSMKNALDYVHLSVGNIEDYEQWNYALPDETVVLLALSKDKALILADQDSYFASINILNPQGMTKEALEALASSFDFSYEPKKVDAAKADARQKEEEADFMADQKALAAASVDWTKVGSYGELLGNLKKDYENLGILDKMYFDSRDLTEDGEPELILGEKNAELWDVYTIENGKTSFLGQISALCEDGIMEEHFFEGDNKYYRYFRFGEDKNVDCISYTPETGWMKSTDGSTYCGQSITEEEAQKIIDAHPYTRGDDAIVWKPLTAFPTT